MEVPALMAAVQNMLYVAASLPLLALLASGTGMLVVAVATLRSM